MKLRRISMLALALASALASTPADAAAHAAPANKTNAARAHVAAADRAYRAGRYAEALTRLRAGYELDPRPEYLIMFAQVYRANGSPRRALEACELYLATAPNGPHVQTARQLAEVLRAETAPEPASPSASALAAPPLVPTTAPPAAVAVAPSATVATSPPPPSPSRRRTVVWATVSAAVIVVIGVGLGVGLGLGLDPGRSTTFGTVRF
jgi:hypothetical protein